MRLSKLKGVNPETCGESAIDRVHASSDILNEFSLVPVALTAEANSLTDLFRSSLGLS
jgi:hypothetical protein